MKLNIPKLNKFAFLFPLLLAYPFANTLAQNNNATANFTIGPIVITEVKGPKVTIPAEHFARRPKLASIQYSPDGKRFAALEEYKGRINIVTVDTTQNKLFRTTGLTEYDVRAFQWINNKRLTFNIVDFKQGNTSQRGDAVYAVDFDGSDGKTMYSNFDRCTREIATCKWMQFQASLGKDSDEIIAVMVERDRNSPDLYRLNTRTLTKTLVTTENPGNVSRYVLDKDFVPRAALQTFDGTRESAFVYRDSATSPWRTVFRGKDDNGQIVPLNFDKDGVLYVSANTETDKAAIYIFDPKANKLGEKIAAHKDSDISVGDSDPGQALGVPASPLILDPVSGAILGLRISGDKPETIWFDEKRAKLQKQIDLTLGTEKINLISPLGSDQYLISSRSGSDPGTFFYFDEPKSELRQLLRPREWINPNQMGTVYPIRYKARDGLVIPGYLTIPAGSNGKNLPLIAWIHGGPIARDEFGWSPDVQFLASRGYAVFQPNFRGSTGYGKNHITASYKQWGQTMQDDITDGINHLAAQGIIDKDRVCIGGGSYGGYATMMGVVKDPDLYKCAINFVGFVNLFYKDLGYADFNRRENNQGSELFFNTIIGDKNKDKEMMTKYSPLFHVDKIKAPVLIAHGAEDARVPLVHAEELRDEMKKKGKVYDWLVIPGEGHGFQKAENRVMLYEKMDEFLAKYLPVKK
jgi:dipeptidyl aminopeptidase/acylaminoacyl peptidase